MLPSLKYLDEQDADENDEEDDDSDGEQNGALSEEDDDDGNYLKINCFFNKFSVLSIKLTNFSLFIFQLLFFR